LINRHLCGIFVEDNSVLLKKQNRKRNSLLMKAQSQYAKAGVNVKLGDLFSSYCGRLNRKTWKNSPFVEVHDFSEGHFRGLRGYEIVNLPPGTIQTAGSDGVGTKPIIITAAELFFTTGDNLLAMVAGDITRYGGLPLILLNDLNLATLGKDENDPTFIAAMKLLEGLVDGANRQNYVLFGGETAELPDCVTSEDPDAILKFIWSAFMIGAVHRDKIITGRKIRPGDRVIALRDGTRSNGISLLRRGHRFKYGVNWYSNPEAKEDIVESAQPSALYDRFLSYMNGWTTENFEPVVSAHGIANLSGGGVLTKFGDDLLFPSGYSAVLKKLWGPPRVMSQCARDLKVSDTGCYGTWGCGNGTMSVVAESDADTFIAHASQFGIEARDAGLICETKAGCKPSLMITSGFTGDEFKHEAGEK